MKNLTLILFMFTSTIAFSQSSEKNIIDAIMKTYNDKDYAAFYDLITPNIKTQMTENNLKDFLSENLYKNYGEIKSIIFKNEKQQQKVYTTQFEKGELDLTLIFNNEFKIDGLSFTPPKAEIIVKKSFLTNNKMESKLDSIVDVVIKPFIQNSINSGISIGIIQNGETKFYHYGETKKETANLPNNNTI